jgi:hypothetical protein
LYIGRWSAALPVGTDANADLMSDNWENAYLGTTNVAPNADPDGDGIANAFEYLFGTSPIQSSQNTVSTTVSRANGQTIIHIIFPRRVGLIPKPYDFEISSDLHEWSPAQGVTETVLSTQGINGVQVQFVDAAIPSPASDRGFARLKWLGPALP